MLTNIEGWKKEIKFAVPFIKSQKPHFPPWPHPRNNPFGIPNPQKNHQKNRNPLLHTLASNKQPF